MENKPNLRAAVDLYKGERPGEENAVRAVCLASVHLPDLDRGMWLSMLEQVQSRQPPGSLGVKRKSSFRVAKLEERFYFSFDLK